MCYLRIERTDGILWHGSESPKGCAHQGISSVSVLSCRRWEFAPRELPYSEHRGDILGPISILECQHGMAWEYGADGVTEQSIPCDSASFRLAAMADDRRPGSRDLD